MAAPTLRFKRGTTSVASSVAVPNTVAGEPIVRYNTDQGKYAGITEFYVGDSGATTSKLVADSGATAAANEILRAFTVETADGNADGVDASLTLTSQDITGSAITVQPPSNLAADYTLTLPADDGDSGQVLQTDGSGVLTWVAQTAGFSGFDIAADTGTAESVVSADTITFTGGTGIDTTVGATNTITIAIDSTVVTTADTGSVTSAMISDGTIVNDDINGSAGIAFSKLASLTGGNILVGNGSNVATSVTASGDVTISNTGAFSVNSVQANSVALGTDTTGNYVQSVTTGATDSGLTGGQTAGEGTTSALALKNIANFTANKVLKWDDTNGQLTDSLITDDGTTVTIGGNLTVTGTTTTVNTTNTVVSDRLLELANGTTGNPTADSGIVIERGDDDNVFIGFDEGSNLFVAGTTAGDGTATDLAPTPIAFLALQYNVTDGAGTNEAVVSYLLAASAPDGATDGRYLQNITVDAGTY